MNKLFYVNPYNISILQEGSSEFTSQIILQLLGLLANKVWLDFQQKQSFLKAEKMTKEANMLLYQCKSHRSLLSLPGGEKRGHSSKSEAAESQEDIKFDSLCKPLSKSVLQGLSAWQIQLTASFGKL